VNIEEFGRTVEEHRRGLVRFVRHIFPAWRDAADLVQDAVARVTADGAYLKYEFEAGTRRAPIWLRQAVHHSGLAAVAKYARRRRLGREAFYLWKVENNITEVIVRPDGDQEPGERGLAVDGPNALDVLVQEEEDRERAAMMATLPADVREVLLARSEGAPWPSEAMRKRTEGALRPVRAARALLLVEEPPGRRPLDRPRDDSDDWGRGRR
jgi:DNA-directed RNA polymerase specialized sigma24 family protein